MRAASLRRLRLPLLASLLLAPAGVEAGDLLEAYVLRDDPSYAWTFRHEGVLAGTAYVELHLTSQTWRGIPWRHQLFVIRPATMTADARHGLLFIDSGRWHEGLEAENYATRLPERAPLFAMVAEMLATPVAVVRQVPFQPLFDGLTEDRLIAYTFERYLESGEEDWPALQPMVKAAVRAMDATQEYAREAWGLELESFTVTGASKRGWTTWLVGAVDARATALAPIVIDMLNIEAHLDLQLSTWGTFSRQIADYTERGLHEQIDSERGQALLAMVDPFRHRARLTQPKLIVIGTNDPYWPLDALELYHDDLPGRNLILYMPNTGHRIEDFGRLIAGLHALHRHAAEGTPLPEPSWRFEQTDGVLRLHVGSDVLPRRVTSWYATSASRDFREALWRSRPCRQVDDGWLCELELPEDGYGALFAELTYLGDGLLPFQLSTQVRIGRRTPSG